MSAIGNGESNYNPHIWSYLHRLITKKAGRTPNIDNVIKALNEHRFENFGVSVVGVAEKRETQKGAKVVYVQFTGDGKTYSICLTHPEIVQLSTSVDHRNFTPVVQPWTLAPKAKPAAA